MISSICLSIDWYLCTYVSSGFFLNTLNIIFFIPLALSELGSSSDTTFRNSNNVFGISSFFPFIIAVTGRFKADNVCPLACCSLSPKSLAETILLINLYFARYLTFVHKDRLLYLVPLILHLYNCINHYFYIIIFHDRYRFFFSSSVNKIAPLFICANLYALYFIYYIVFHIHSDCLKSIF